MYPTDVKYTKDHEWVRVEGAVCTVGITSFAAEQLGDVTYVELPEVDAAAKQGEVVAAVESVKAASDVYAPVSGRVAAINEALDAQPELVNASPYGDGWFFKLADVEEGELADLMDAAAYEAYVEETGE